MYQTTLQSMHCQAFIAINRNRLKVTNLTDYLDRFGQLSVTSPVCYLKHGQEFEIELFNPTQSTQLAKISINGKSISTSGIVIKPGQRIYLERYLDSPQKFLFSTYEIENSDESKLAAAKNGNIQIQFYEEQSPYNSNSLVLNTSYGTGTAHYRNSAHTLTSYNNDFNSKSFLFSSKAETGRIESGFSSNQGFTQYNGQFNNYTSNTVNIKLLPISQKPLESKDLGVYCTGCGTKNKKNWKFCPKCGTKY